MAMLSARKSKRGDESGARFPAFVLGSENLDSYRPWLKRMREWTRKQGGRIMEAHLIGEEVEVEDLAGVDVEAADADVVGHCTEDGVGAEGGRRQSSMIDRPDRGGAIHETTTSRHDISVIDR